jgi:hypothetical protein
MTKHISENKTLKLFIIAISISFSIQNGKSNSLSQGQTEMSDYNKINQFERSFSEYKNHLLSILANTKST